MPKSTNTKKVEARVPESLHRLLQRKVFILVYEETKDELYLYIRDNPHATIQEVRQHFGHKKSAKAVINMCKRTGLLLKDLPAK